ncbi:hypothetical protein [Mangrovimonas xylaniphaga]|uniref:hypothetical protein n=1 Tax=Mangrovimonas xylaniphaga TaxID=1645915 RepID=UPI0012F844DA|nr:hypothetical protein [Mangrovimonas xylaniphaga]
MNQHKFGRYLLYALGEMTLIVLGILIALKVDNWNQEQVLKRHETQVLKQLLNHAQADYSFFSSKSDFFDNQEHLYQELLRLCNHTLPDSLLMRKQLNVFNLFGKATIQSNIVNSNFITYDIISNQQLKKQLLDYKRQYEAVKISYDLFNSKTTLYTDPILVQNYADVLKINEDTSWSDLEPFCDYPNIEGISYLLSTTASFAQQQTKTLLDLNNELTQELEQVLESKK